MRQQNGENLRFEQPLPWNRALHALARAGRRFIAVNGGLRSSWGKLWRLYRAGGLAELWYRLPSYVRRGETHSLCHELSPTEAAAMLRRCPNQPLLSIAVPVHKVEPCWLERCIRSVSSQHYGRWELVLVDDCSERPALRELMQRWKQADARIKVHFLDRPAGIAGATNAAIHHCSGTWIGFLDHDDELTPDALTWVVHSMNEFPQAQWIYSDEDKIDVTGKRHSPTLKPDFSPEYLLAAMFTCHFSVYHADLIRRVGGLRAGFEGSQDHDLALRLSEIVAQEQVVHIPKILYHWRTLPSSTSFSVTAKQGAPVAGRRAVADALERRGLQGTAQSHPFIPTIYRIRLRARRQPSVSVLVSAGESQRLLVRCLRALYQRASYPRFDVVICTRSSGRQLFDLLPGDLKNRSIRVQEAADASSKSAMINAAVRALDSELIMLLDGSLEIVSDAWLEQMVASLDLGPNIAGVGGLLSKPNGFVHHAGYVVGIHQAVGHAHRFARKLSGGYCGRSACVQELSAVSADFMLLRRKDFLQAGGFRAERYPHIFADVDLWLRLRRLGRRCLYNPAAEALVRHADDRAILAPANAVFRRHLLDDWGKILPHDPFHNPNLALDNEQFGGYRAMPVSAVGGERADRAAVA